MPVGDDIEDSDVVCEDRTELQQRRFGVMFVHEVVKVKFGELEKLAEGFVKEGAPCVCTEN